MLPNGVPFVEGIFGGGAGEELDGSGLGSDGCFAGGEDIWHCRSYAASEVGF